MMTLGRLMKPTELGFQPLQPDLTRAAIRPELSSTSGAFQRANRLAVST